MALLLMAVSMDANVVLLEQRFVELEQRYLALEQRLAEIERKQRSTKCDNEFPVLKGPISYGGCNRNMLRYDAAGPQYDAAGYDAGWPGNFTTETCQSGVLTFYNTSSTNKTGLFDAKIEVLHSPDKQEVGCIYHFTCTYTRDEPHAASCTLTFQEPPTPMGPAFGMLQQVFLLSVTHNYVGDYLYLQLKSLSA